jgi:hypothetical protein
MIKVMAPNQISGHTNEQWHPYADQGSYFRLMNGILLQRPMLTAGGMGTEDIEVDWNNGVSAEDLPLLTEIVRELETKQ